MKSLWTFIIIAFILVILVIVAIVIARKNAVNAAMLAAQQNGMPLSPPQALGLNQVMPVSDTTLQAQVINAKPILMTPSGLKVTTVAKESALKF